MAVDRGREEGGEEILHPLPDQHTGWGRQRECESIIVWINEELRGMVGEGVFRKK